MRSLGNGLRRLAHAVGWRAARVIAAKTATSSSVALLAVLLVAGSALRGWPNEVRPFNPYERPKNGPPLDNVFGKVQPEWLYTKLRAPRHDPAARMPEFEFTDEEALDIMAYLGDLNDLNERAESDVEWPAWADKSIDEMDDEEFFEAMDLADRGRAIWGNARCTICHTVNGPGGGLIGGFVDLRVGGIDLQFAATKLRRDWLYRWIKEPKDYFAGTLMPRYRFSNGDIRALVEFILRDDAFIPEPEPREDVEPIPTFQGDRWQRLAEPERVARGRRLVDLSRCVVCHDIAGMEDLIEPPARPEPPPRGSFEFLLYDLRCLSCHSLSGRGGTYAPDLTGEGSRLQESWIAQFLESPDMIRPLFQQMPKFNLTGREAKTIASHMSANELDPRIPTSIPGGPVTAEEIEHGRELYRSKGCRSCHSIDEGPEGVVGPTLMNVGGRLGAGYIWYHLGNPHAVNPYSPEPDYGLPDEQTRALAAYLASRKQ